MWSRNSPAAQRSLIADESAIAVDARSAIRERMHISLSHKQIDEITANTISTWGESSSQPQKMKLDCGSNMSQAQSKQLHRQVLKKTSMLLSSSTSVIIFSHKESVKISILVQPTGDQCRLASHAIVFAVEKRRTSSPLNFSRRNSSPAPMHCRLCFISELAMVSQTYTRQERSVGLTCVLCSGKNSLLMTYRFSELFCQHYANITRTTYCCNQ